MSMIVPVLVSYTETDWAVLAGLTKVTPTFVWQEGDVIIALAAVEDSAVLSLSNTGVGLSLATQKQNNPAAAGTSGSLVQACRATASSSGTVTVTVSAGSKAYGVGVWVWRRSVGFGNSFEQHTTVKTVNMAPDAQDSAMCWGIVDFSAEAAHTMVPAPTNIRQAAVVGVSYAIHVADFADQPSPQASAYGVSGGTSTGPYSIVGVEVKGSPVSWYQTGNVRRARV
jgi:hypothetical protein